METVNSLIEKLESGKRLKYIFFLGHTAKGGGIDKSCFSQWFQSPFEHKGNCYETVEHWMMVKKAELFDDTEMLKKIITAESPGKAQALGREIKGFNQAVWDENKLKIVIEGNLLKFRSNPNLTSFLISTGDRILVEASPVDPIWGVGLAQDNERVLNPSEWNGTNLLGFVLMDVRKTLKDNN